MRAIGQQVNLGGAADSLGQSLAELTVEEAHDLAHALERESFAPQLTDYGDFREASHRIQAAVALALRLDHAALIPPLELTRGDSGKSDHVPGCEELLHPASLPLETNLVQNVSDILGMSGCGSSRRIGGGG